MATSNSFRPNYSAKGNWRVYVQHEGFSDNVVIWLGEHRDARFYNATVGQNGYLELAESKEGEQPAPLLRVPAMIWQQIVDAIATEVTPTKQEVVDAELLATKYHLEDMRKLVFKTKPKDAVQAT